MAASVSVSIVVDRPHSPGSSRPAKARIAEQLGRLPLSFVENRGQADPRVGYYIQGSKTSVYFTEAGLRMGLQDTGGTAQRWNLALDFVGARTAPPKGVGRTPAVVSYFKGDPQDWHTGLPTYSRVAYRDLWPGIDLVYSGTGSRLKYSFVLDRGVDPARIGLRWRGATALSLDEGGRLQISTPARTFTDQAPVSYQRVGDRRVEVPTSYVLDGDRYGFHLGSYDLQRKLVIDPAMLLYAGYIGGSGDDFARGIAVDGTGAAYVTGETDSTEATFPETMGPDLTYNGGTSDAFVAKVAPSGASLAYAGYIGGSDLDRGGGVAVDGTGAAYVTGITGSTEATFPVAVGPDLTLDGASDAFVAKVVPSGASLAYAGYIGGSGSEFGNGVAVDGTGAAYVTGLAGSNFPVAVGPDLTHNGGSDAFVAKVAPSGASLAYAGYIGGSDLDLGLGVAVDGMGAAYVTGGTDSTEATFPETVGPDLTHNGGVGDAFVAKVAPSGVSLAYAGYIGGSDLDRGFGVAVDGTGAAYVTGQTASTEATFPVAVGPDLTYNGGVFEFVGGDAFVAKVAPSGASLAYAGYIGGSANDSGGGVAVDGTGAAYVTGGTESTEATFPVPGGPDLTYNGGINDAFVAKVAPSGASLAYAGYIGGSGDDRGTGVAVDAAGNAYVTGFTGSTEATFPETVGPDLTHNGSMRDAFVAKVSTDLCAEKAVSILGSSAGETLTGTPGDDVIVALGGADIIDGMGGNDTICGGDGNDTLVGGEGNDLLDGEAGTDTLIGGAGNDVLNGGTDTDTASFPGTAGVTVDLVAKTGAGQGSDTLAGIENLIGSFVKDVLRGDGLANRLGGLGGADRLLGRGGKDALIGGKGHDRLFGGGGKDRLKGEGGRDRLSGGGGRDGLAGGRGRDHLDGGRGRDTCDGGRGLDSARRCERLRRIP